MAFPEPHSGDAANLLSERFELSIHRESKGALLREISPNSFAISLSLAIHLDTLQ
jgi:hypothetical protein